MAEQQWDLAVIGTGGAAMAAGIEARSRGKSVVLIEDGPLGGTCLNVGCVPSKALLAASEHRHRALRNPFPSAPTSAHRVDLTALVAAKQELVEELRQARYAAVADAHGFPIRYGHATFVDGHTLHVDGATVSADAFVIATGAQPAVPEVRGIADVPFLTSTSAMELRELPRSLVVLGAGYVGLEQAQLWAHLGVPVTLVGRFAPHTEPDLADVLRPVFLEDGVALVEDHAVEVAATAAGTEMTTRGGLRVVGEQLLVATGRSPRTGGLGLSAAGVQTDARGFITVDQHQRTTNPRIYAAGDVAGVPQYVYVAAQTGRVAAAAAFGDPATIDYRGLPAVTFTTPQLAMAGLTEQQAIDRGHRCESRLLPASDIPRALVNRDTRGALKIIIDADTRTVLGVHAVLDGAGDVMLAATYAIRAGMTAEEIADTWAPYLTMAEALRLCAGLFRSTLPTSCCA